MDTPLTITVVPVFKHWDDNGKIRRAIARILYDAVPPPPT